MDTKYEMIMEKLSSSQRNDPTNSWSLPDTVFGLAFVLIFYLMTVVIILPDFMRYRAPFKLNKLLNLYNAVQVAYSVYLLAIYTMYILKHGIITKRCPQGNDLIEVMSDVWPYFIAKHLDLLDTVFFVLRKKDNQVTFLHLYHHTAMVSWTWLHMMYHPSDHFVVVGLLNSFVHVLMYAYYGLSSLGPQYSKFLWWKKHLTKVQLVQFILVLSDLHYQQKLSPCPIPAFFHNLCLFWIGSFFVLFMNFYFRSYKKKQQIQHEAKELNNNVQNKEFSKDFLKPQTQIYEQLYDNITDELKKKGL